VMPACVGGMFTRMTLRSIVFNSDAESDSRSSFICVANDSSAAEVSSESRAKQ
jgi:hypothetical protein